MQIPKPSPSDVARFRSMVPDAPGVEVKPMFGNLGAFLNGNMFMGLLGPDIGLKLAADDATALGAVEGAGPFGPADRPMGGYVTLPPSLVGTPEGERWVAASVRNAASLPPKRKAPK